MLNEKEKMVLDFIESHPNVSSSEITEGLNGAIPLSTLKRILGPLVSVHRFVETTGNRKSTRYRLSRTYQLFVPINIDTYFSREIDERTILTGFNFDLISHLLHQMPLFNEEEMQQLTALQKRFTDNMTTLTPVEYRMEMERLGVDLSWKSSQIEGNTYSLLETEKLLREKETAAGKTKDEAIMLLNHKDALDFIVANSDYMQTLTPVKIENIHRLLIKDLGVGYNIRTRRVGITGTNYHPIDNEFQIREAMEQTCAEINSRNNVFEKALLALVLLSYIQPFMDGNKRTARIVSNALLIANGYCPLSFRTVDSIDYKKAMLLFYEQNNLNSFKQIFMEQFAFAVSNYF